MYYQEMTDAGRVDPNQSFAEWFPHNDPGYMSAVSQVSAMANAFQMETMSLGGGPLVNQWMQHMQTLNQATMSMEQRATPGLTMEATSAKPPPLSQVLSEGPPPDPANTYCVPFFSSPQYQQIVAQWQQSASEAPSPTGVHELDPNEASNTSGDEFGHSDLGDSSRVFKFAIDDYGGGSSAGSLNLTPSNVKITMSWDATDKAQLETGKWDINDPHGTYPQLRPGAPNDVKTLVRPVEMLLASKLCFEIEFSDDAKDAFDRLFNDVANHVGYIRVFGVAVAIADNVRDNTTHAGTWDDANGIFVVTPIADTGLVTVLAVTGEKLATS
ncbi:hypothetical protein NX059_009169 [Plenodomus lindquistii]|nr:hypothetical protein NX059_009169 [Plenodomus lindquistii]